MRSVIAAPLAALLACAASSLGAQRSARAGLARAGVESQANATHPAVSVVRSRGGEATSRTALGMLGGAGGMLLGGFLGYQTPVGDDCHCDDPGLTGTLYGAALGGVLGAAALAAAPIGASSCTFMKRFGIAAVGAGLGALGGALVGSAASGGAGVVVGWTVGAGAGASMGAMRCRDGG